MSTKVDNYGAIGWKPQQPMVISGADYKLGPDYAGHIGVPVQLDTALGTSGVDTNDQNKRWVKPYIATDSSAVALGVMFKELGAKGNVNERRLGMGGYRRDIALLQFGIVPILNVGSTTLTMYDRVSPLYNTTDGLSGFGPWSAGYKILGYCFQAEIPAGHYGWIFVTVEVTPAPTTELADLSAVTITGPAVDGDILIWDTTVFKDVPLTLGLAVDVTETSIATGEALMWNGSAYVNSILFTELVTMSAGATDQEGTLSHTPLSMVSVYASDVGQVNVAQYTEDLTTSPVATLTYDFLATALLCNKATDADTHVMVTYWYDANA